MSTQVHLSGRGSVCLFVNLTFLREAIHGRMKQLKDFNIDLFLPDFVYTKIQLFNHNFDRTIRCGNSLD